MVRNVGKLKVLTVNELIERLQALPAEQRALPVVHPTDGPYEFFSAQGDIGKVGRVAVKWPHWSVWEEEPYYDMALPVFMLK